MRRLLVAWLAVGCAGGAADETGPTPTGDTAAPSPTTDPCDAPAALGTIRLACDGGAWTGTAAVLAGCPLEVDLDLWEPSLRHERHPFRAEGAATTWTLGPLPAAVDRADWSPGVASALPCDAPDATYVISVTDASGPTACVAWGPRAAEVAGLPGAVAALPACRIE